jgi:putative NADPH-quinone reductase
MEEKKFIPILYSSSNQQGNSALLVDWLLARVNQKKYKFEKNYLYDLQIEKFCNDNYHPETITRETDKDARRLVASLKEASQIIITTPIWNFGVPSVLKNFLDRCLSTGRIKSNERRKKVPAWHGKKFYLLFTMGAKWYLAWPDYLGVLQIMFILWYYGASVKIVKMVYDCGNGQRVMINHRKYLQNSLGRKGRRLFS